MVLETLSCDGGGTTDFVAGGWKVVGGWTAGMNISLRGSTLLVSMEIPAGHTPGPAPPAGAHVVYDDSCPSSIEKAAGI
jgi:hypothetical protein